MVAKAYFQDTVRLAQVRGYLAMITCEICALESQSSGEEADYLPLQEMTVSRLCSTVTPAHPGTS